MPAALFAVRGNVQGVGFRWFATTTARGLGLAGWVRNVPDGSVEALASGPEAALAAFEQALAQGPAGAQVEAVSRSPAHPEHSPKVPFSQLR